MSRPRTAVLTGATAGIGQWIALGLAKRGFHLVLIIRDPARGKRLRGWIERQVPAATIELVQADLSSLEQTRAAARQIAAAHPAIDLLVNNAGIFLARRVETAEGHDKVLATNLLAPFILMTELEPALRAAAPSRIVTVGSSSSDRARIDPAHLELRPSGSQGAGPSWGMVRAYAQSKLAVMIVTFEMARRLQGSNVVANVVHPGTVATTIVRSPGIIGLAWRAMRPFLRTERQGAETPLHVALDAEPHVTGLYFKDRRPVSPNRLALEPTLAQTVWAATEAMTCPGPSIPPPPGGEVRAGGKP